MRPSRIAAVCALGLGCGFGCGNAPAPPAKSVASDVAADLGKAPSVARRSTEGSSALDDVEPGPPTPGATAVGSADSASPAGSYSPVGHLEGVDRLAHVFAALSSLEEGRGHDDVRIAQYGDSHTASDVGPAVLRHDLQARFGDGGRGFVSLGKPWKTYLQDGIRGGMTREFEPLHMRGDDGRIIGDGCYGLLGFAIGSDRPGARAWTRVSAQSSRIEIDYWQQPRGGSFDVFVDGSRTARVTTRADEPSDGFFALDVPDAAHEVELRTVGDGQVRVFGMALDRAQAGVLVDTLGINGAQVATPLRWNEQHFARQLGRRAPDLVILAYGTNEALEQHLDMDQYQRALVELLGRFARAVPSASCLLLGPPDLARRGAEGQDPWATWPRILDVIRVQRRVAAAAGCAFYDQLEAMGGPGSMAAWASESEPRGARDRVHLTRSGYTELASDLSADLLRAYDQWKAGGGSARRTWGVALR